MPNPAAVGVVDRETTCSASHQSFVLKRQRLANFVSCISEEKLFEKMMQAVQHVVYRHDSHDEGDFEAEDEMRGESEEREAEVSGVRENKRQKTQHKERKAKSEEKPIAVQRNRDSSHGDNEHHNRSPIHGSRAGVQSTHQNGSQLHHLLLHPHAFRVPGQSESLEFFRYAASAAAASMAASPALVYNSRHSTLVPPFLPSLFQ